VSHRLEIGRVVARNVADAVGELLPAGKTAASGCLTARHGLAPHIDDLAFRQQEMDKSDVTEVVGHLVDKEWLMPTVCARGVRQRSPSVPKIFRRKFG
jgi:hypothetical protein